MKNAKRRLVVAIVLMIISQGLIPSIRHAHAAQPHEKEAPFSLPEVSVGQAYEYEFNTEGGLPPLTWRLVSGELPPGVTLDPSGKLRGVPTTQRGEAYRLVIEVSDSSQPPQRFAQPFLLAVRATPLQIVTGPGKSTSRPTDEIRMKKQDPTAPLEVSRNNHPATADQTEAFSRSSPVPFRLPAPYLSNVSLLTAGSVTVSKPSAGRRSVERELRSDEPKPPPGQAKKISSPFGKYEAFNPATFIRIYEDSKRGDRYLIYEPNRRDMSGSDPQLPKLGQIVARRYEHRIENQVRTLPTQLAVDEDSTIVIEPLPEAMDPNMPLNKLFMRASLKKGDKTAQVEVKNYAEVGKDEAKMAAQRATAFQTTKNIQATLLNLSFTARDLLKYVYGEDPSTRGCPGTEVAKADEEARKKARGEKEKELLDATTPAFKRLRDRVRFSLPEITALTEFLLAENNIKLVQIIGNDVFWIDAASMKEIAQQIQKDLAISSDASLADNNQARTDALRRIFERAKLIYEDFREPGMDIQRLKQMTAAEYKAAHPLPKDEDHPFGKKPEYSQAEEDLFQLLAERGNRTLQCDDPLNFLIHEKATLVYAEMRAQRALEVLKDYFVPGYVSLENADADDGNLLTLTVEARSSEGDSGGVVAEYQIAIKRFGAKLTLGSTMMFLNRKGVSEGDGSGLKAVNYAPSPGMNFGVTFFKRGDHTVDKVLRALAPTVGVNVSFMNFNDPGFDLSTDPPRFTNTTGTDVQVGTGPFVSLFNNKIDITTGWNLNVDKKRRYFGIGFGFIEIGKFLKDRLKPQ